MICRERKAKRVSAIWRCDFALFHAVLALDLHLARRSKRVPRRRQLRIQRVIARQLDVHTRQICLGLKPQLSAQIQIRPRCRCALRDVQTACRHPKLDAPVENASAKAVAVDHDFLRPLRLRQGVILRLHRRSRLHQIEIAPHKQRMNNRPLPLTQHRRIAALTRDIKPPDAGGVLMHPHVAIHRVLDQSDRYHRVLLRGREVTKHAHMITRAVLAVAAHHVLDVIIAHARAVDAAHMHRVPAIAEPVVRVIKEPRITRRVAGENRRAVHAGHRPAGRNKNALRNTAGLIRQQQDRAHRVDAGQRLRLLGARRPATNKATLRRALQLNPVRLDIEQRVKRRLEPLGQ